MRAPSAHHGGDGWEEVHVLFRPFFLGVLADAYLRAEQLTEGLTVVDEALSLVSQTQERWIEAELWRLKGELTRQTGLECLPEAEKLPS
jgi:hypothetical protein